MHIIRIILVFKRTEQHKKNKIYKEARKEENEERKKLKRTQKHGGWSESAFYYQNIDIDPVPTLTNRNFNEYTP